MNDVCHHCDEKMRTDNKSIRLPEELAGELDQFIGKQGFRSRSEVVRVAIRDFLSKNKILTPVGV